MEPITIWLVSALLCNVMACITTIIGGNKGTLKEGAKVLLGLNLAFFLFGPLALAIMFLFFIGTLFDI